jgi:hypothetical protein
MPDAGTATSVATTNRQFNQNQVYPSWEYDLLRTLGGDPTKLPVQLQVLYLWSKFEGVTETAHNWLAVSQGANNAYPLPDATGDLSGNPDDIATFATTAGGVTGIAAFLRAGYPNLVKALTNPNATVDDITSEIPVNAWGGDAAKINAAYGQSLTQPITVPKGTNLGEGGDNTGNHGSATFTQCTGATIIGGGGLGVHWTALNSCQAKALVGGFLVGVGAAMMVGSLALIVTGSLAGSKLASTAAGLTPAKAGANVAKNIGASSGLTSLLSLGRGSAPSSGGQGGGEITASSTPSPSQPSRVVFDGQVLNPAMTQYRRDNGDAATRDVLARQKATLAREKERKAKKR